MELCVAVAARVGRALIFSPLMLLIFVWAHLTSKDSPDFLWFMYSSFVFLGLATLLLLSADVEHASKKLKRIFYAFVAIAILVTVGVALSIASDPPGGKSHSYHITPENVEINLEYSTFPEKPGYHGSWPQKILDVDYSIRGAWIFYELREVHVYTDKNVYSNLTFRFSLGFWPNRKYYRSIYESEEETVIHNGTESLVSFEDYTYSIHWGAGDRLDKGYTVYLSVGIKLEGPNYGSLKATILPTPTLRPDVWISDEQVSSQLQDGVAVLLCGVFAGALCYMPAKVVKPKIVRRFAPMVDLINNFFAVQGTPKGFLKKCVECGKEIPIASEECQYCKTKQP